MMDFVQLFGATTKLFKPEMHVQGKYSSLIRDNLFDFLTRADYSRSHCLAHLSVQMMALGPKMATPRGSHV